MVLTFSDIRTMHDLGFAEAMQTIDAQNRDRIERIRSHESARLSLAALLLAKSAISRAAGVPERDIRILRDSRGKPHTDLPGVFFSLSHCAPYAVCACSGRPVGVDAERIRPISPAILRKICTQDELARLPFNLARPEDRSPVPEERDPGALRLLFSLWCLKESWAKLRGDGLFPASREISFTVNGTAVCSDRPGLTFTLDFETLPGFVLAAASQVDERV